MFLKRATWPNEGFYKFLQTMSKYDKIFNAYAKSSEKLTPVEGLFAIALIVVYADGEMSAKELELFRGILASGAVKGYSQADFRIVSGKIDTIWDLQGTGALLNAAIEALPTDMREDAYTVAVAFAIADGRVTKEESEYLEKLARALEIPEAKAEQIVAEEWNNFDSP
jgi:tellurite resistance protein